jgi:thiamine biosynthesis lipoprotein
VDPHTGIGLTNRLGVTVVARDAATTDALATAVSVLGAARGLALIERQPRAAALIVQLDAAGGKKLVESSRFSKVAPTVNPTSTRSTP